MKYLPRWRTKSFLLWRLRQENCQDNAGELRRILLPRTPVNKGRDSGFRAPRLACGWCRHPVSYGEPQHDEIKGHWQQFRDSEEAHHEEERDDSSSDSQHPPPAKRNPPPHHRQCREDKHQCSPEAGIRPKSPPSPIDQGQAHLSRPPNVAWASLSRGTR